VLDEDGQDLPHIRAERGPGNRSWVRQCTSAVLAKFFTHADVRAARGMFISPFRAQAKAIAAFFASEGLHSWTSSTVHSQQGAEADVVVFDTVNAGSYSWPHDEWKRLINVAVSRAREAVIVLASRAEMTEPYLQPLSGLLAPRVLRRASGRQQFVEVPSKIQYTPTNNTAPAAPHSLGRQIESRKKLRPVMSSEQQRLCGLKLDGGPRLVRGVAGSGKTVVLAHWLAKAMRDMEANPDAAIWVVYANKTLRSLVEDTVRSAWGSDESNGAFPEGGVQFHHIKELLDTLLREAGVRDYEMDFDYNSAAAQYRLCRQGKPEDYRCSALYIDEAQDMGPSTLEVLASLVKPMDSSQPTKKAVNIFYDNAQNIYRRGTPNWAQLGLDMRGRSAVMRESFRSTLPIAEYALNVLYSFESPDADEDHKELLRRGLVEKTSRRGQDWWSVRYNQVHGPSPVLRTCRNESEQYAAVGDYLCELIEQERVDPADICLLYIGNRAADRIQEDVAQRLRRLDVSLAVRRGESFSRSANEILVTTPHSFKGYDAEVVVIPAANKFYATQRGVLANELYVAMTRARSLVSLFTGDMSSPITAALRQCLDQLEDCPTVDRQVSAWDDYTEMLGIVGDAQSSWLEKVMHSFQIQQEPLPSPDGEILVEPLFWFKHRGKLFVCPHPRRDSGEMRDRVQRHGVEVLEVGQALPV
jgi:superfamily I DNA/RNA helicase